MKKVINFTFGFVNDFSADINREKLASYLNKDITVWSDYCIGRNYNEYAFSVVGGGNLSYYLEASGLDTKKYYAMALSCFEKNTCELVIKINEDKELPF